MNSLTTETSSSKLARIVRGVFIHTGVLVILAALASTQVSVQAQQNLPAKPKDVERKRSEVAIELVIETADSARSFKDLFYRARVQALAADTLWQYDEPRARAIFRRAWEAATASDKAEQEIEDRESGVPSAVPITEARDEVMARAATRDAKLAEAFLKDLVPEKKNETDSADNNQETRHRTPWRELSEMGLRRLALADELLKNNQPKLAAEIVAPVVDEGTSGDFISFLIRLRQQSPSDADALYLRLIERTRADVRSDANDVLLLSAPIVSPKLLVVVDNQGALLYRPILIGIPVAAGFADAVRKAFYEVTAGILLRPIVPRAEQNITLESIGIYFALGRVFPFFERDAPQFVSALRVRNSTLANAIEAGRRDNLDGQFELTSMTPDRPVDPLRAQVNQLGRARDAQDRDRIALGIVKRAAKDKLWDHARRAANEIENVDVRRAALSYLAVTQIADLLRAFADDKEENFDGLAKFVRSADVPALVGAWGLAQTAVIASRKGNSKTATALLDEAVEFAARTPAGTWQRMAAYVTVGQLAARFDTKRALQLLPDVVRAANVLEKIDGDEDSIEIGLANETPDSTMEPLSFEADTFRLETFFGIVAKLDFDKALDASRSIVKESPRAFASLAIARATLHGNGKF